MPSTRSTNSGWRLDSFFASAREPIFFLTSDRRIAMVNRAWEDLTGHRESEVIGLECRPHGPTRAGDLTGLGGSFYPPPEAMAGQPSGGRTSIVRRGGERVQRRVEFWPLHDSSGQLTGLFGIVRPVESPPQAPDGESQSLRFALLDIRARMFARHGHDTIIGQGPAHRRVVMGIDTAVASTVPITIVGESGTGKRFVARMIHQRGPSRQMPLLGYDCQAIPPEILERELFGGSDLGDPTSDQGRLVAPEGSTIVLGDVLRLPRDLQTRLASALTMGDRHARLIATTSGNLEDAFRSETLRPDLFHALTALVIHLRPLRERVDELPILAQAILERANLRGQTSRSGLSPSAIEILSAYDWPGNLRELVQVIDEAHKNARGDRIEADDLPGSIQGKRGGAYITPSRPTPTIPLKDRLVAFERQVIEEALGQARQNKTRAAKRLGVNRPFLYRRIKELGIEDVDTPSFGESVNSSDLVLEVEPRTESDENRDPSTPDRLPE